MTLDAKKLHALARDTDAPGPAIFETYRQTIETKQREIDDLLYERDTLIKQLREIGIPITALSRWTGVSTRRLDEIIHDR